MPEPDGLPTPRYVLSRFAYLRHDGQSLVLESSLTPARLPASEGLLALLHRLSRPVSLAALLDALPPASREATRNALDLLVEHGFLSPADGTEADDAPSLSTWEFHDLLFHARTRHGRTSAPIGGTYRFGAEAPPETLPPPSPDRVPLPGHGRRGRMPLSEAFERRTSTRDYGGDPFSVADLSALLSLAVRETHSQGRRRRPYPSGGATYPTGLFVLVRTCEGLSPGAYRYQPADHALDPVTADAEDIETLFRDGARAAGAEALAPILLVVTARFARTAWKYESIAYSLVLKEVGALYQSLWLAGAALGIAVCGLGTGNADAFAETLGLDYYRETSVGEVLIGPLPTGRTAPAS